jgi:DNA-binding IclR family transcriptional regulator
MSAAKAHRYLVSFQRLQLVVQDAASTRYDLGPAALKLGLASLERLDAVKLARERVTAADGTHRPHAGAGGVGQPRPDHRALGGVAAPPSR